MKAYVVGAGAIGTFLGESLRELLFDVRYAPRALEAVGPSDAVDADIAIVAVKAFDTPGAIATLQRAGLDPTRTAIVTPQNGIGNEEALAAAFGADSVVACALTVPVELDAQGRPLPANSGGIGFAPVGGSRNVEYVSAAFAASALPTMRVRDYRALKWSKLALNLVANAGCAILDVTPAELVADPRAFDLEIRAMREVHAIMRALQIRTLDLPRYPVRALQTVASLPLPIARSILADRIAGARGAKPPSLLLDLRAGKARTELDALNGAVAAAARSAGVAAPVNTVVTRVLSEIVHAPAVWEKYRRRPDRLLAEVEAELAPRPLGGTHASP